MVLNSSVLDSLIPQLPEYYLPYPFLKHVPAAKRREIQEKLWHQTASHLLISEDEQFILAVSLDWDSHFFNSRIYKVEAVHVTSHEGASRLLAELERQLRSREADYIFGMFPAEDSVVLESAGRTGWSLIESRLLYWRARLDRFEPARRYPVRLASDNDVAPLGDVAARTRNPYDRFHTDPFFTESEANRLMREWVKASILNHFADAVLVPTHSPTAFMTLRYGKSFWPILGERLSQLVFSAVSSQSHGWYPMLVSESLVHLKEHGASSVCLTTQAANRTVIRTLEHFDFKLGQTTLVFRKWLSHRAVPQTQSS